MCPKFLIQPFDPPEPPPISCRTHHYPHWTHHCPHRDPPPTSVLAGTTTNLPSSEPSPINNTLSWCSPLASLVPQLPFWSHSRRLIGSITPHSSDPQDTGQVVLLLDPQV
ncbi:Uncharacterized protein Fot_43600 [Forsythia ovata]|uniref:Uncharacterized protein n=1 Tax=Forsythia ovata TaxID=205694 RepID=A0ABD1R1Z0_9LAMI